MVTSGRKGSDLKGPPDYAVGRLDDNTSGSKPSPLKRARQALVENGDLANRVTWGANVAHHDTS